MRTDEAAAAPARGRATMLSLPYLRRDLTLSLGLGAGLTLVVIAVSLVTG